MDQNSYEPMLPVFALMVTHRQEGQAPRPHLYGDPGYGVRLFENPVDARSFAKGLWSVDSDVKWHVVVFKIRVL